MTGPATPASSGAPPIPTPATRWRTPSPPRWPGAPAASAGCSPRSGCATSSSPSSTGPAGRAGRPLPALDTALGNQLDLARLGSDPGLALYQNQAWFPGRAVVATRRGPIPGAVADPARAAAGHDLTGTPPLGTGSAGPGTVLWFEADDAGWQAHADGRTLAHRPAFGVTNQFRLPSHARVTITHTGQGRTYELLGAEGALWLLAVLWWSRGRRRRGREPDRAAARAAARAAREERRAGSSSPLDTDVEFWERA